MNKFIYLFVCLFNYLFIYSFLYSFIHSFVFLDKYSSLTLTDSDEDSDETTLFEAKKRIPNGSVNGSIGRKAM